MHRLITVAASILACAIACSAATAQQTSAANRTFVLTYKYVPGQLRNYKADVAVRGTVGSGPSAHSINQDFDELFNQQVQSVNSSDDATIATHIIAAQQVLGGKKTDYSDEQIQQMQPGSPEVVCPTGRIIDPGATSADTANAGAGSYLKLDQSQIMPSNPVAIGASWRSTVDAPGLTLFTRSTLDRVLTGRGGSIAQISTKYYGMTGRAGSHIEPGPGKTYLLETGQGVTEFNISTGTVQSVTVRLDTHASFPASATGAKDAEAQQSVKAHLVTTMHMELLGKETGQ